MKAHWTILVHSQEGAFENLGDMLFFFLHGTEAAWPYRGRAHMCDDGGSVRLFFATACLTTVGNAGDAAVARSNTDVVSVDLQVGDEDIRMIR